MKTVSVAVLAVFLASAAYAADKVNPPWVLDKPPMGPKTAAAAVSPPWVTDPAPKQRTGFQVKGGTFYRDYLLRTGRPYNASHFGGAKNFFDNADRYGSGDAGGN